MAISQGSLIEASDIILKTYPVGAIYLSTSNTSPATLFGGTWEQIKDRFLLAAGDTYTAGNTSGSATHTITTDEMPEHTHTFTGSAATSGNNSANPSIDAGGYHGHSLNADIGQFWKPNTCWWGADGGGGFWGYYWGGSSYGSANGNGSHGHGVSGSHTHSVTAAGTIDNAGSGTAMNIMPPYLVVYMWKRTA